MEITSSLAISVSSPCLSRPPKSSLLLSSSHSTFFTTTISLSNSFKATSLVLGQPSRRRTDKAKKAFSCNALFGLGVPELVVIAGVAALVFGPKKLPEVGKSIGKTVKSFQQCDICELIAKALFELVNAVVMPEMLSLFVYGSINNIGVQILQAAKEFETELKKEPDSITDQPGEKSTAVVSEEEKQEDKASSSKESV
ncbi:hypothetical protein JRO89_XS04G0164800 [Xanthoceras sorbifolium]|uniref:Uncharacterized protein n=1 Tax=Xanthoceras sorbifolium TaxID=99658 RepID=A0ABQ8I643_9ROSI|nr:hypothetical protein JRO89_XS04G0164800 [Xanthoceras sorbifolium]